MSSVGRMDSAFFVSRSELIEWANSTFQLSISKVEQCSNGAVYCQIIDAVHPGCVAMKKVNWNARAEHDAIPNYKILQQAFVKCNIQKHIEVDKLIRGKYQDNLEIFQWIKSYYENRCQGGEYDALARRFGDVVPDWAQPGGAPPAPVRQAAPAAPRRAADPPAAARSPPVRSGRDRGNSGSAGGYPGGTSRRDVPGEQAGVQAEHEKLREEIVDLKITVDGLETERDFYFQKLRDIEILCQELEAKPDPNMKVSKFLTEVQQILYARDDEDEGGAGDLVEGAF